MDCTLKPCNDSHKTHKKRNPKVFSHMMVGTNDIEKSKTFYDAIFAAVGGKEAIIDPKGRLVYLHNGSAFLVTPPIDGAPATPGNGMTVGFAMETTELAGAWHAAGAVSYTHLTLPTIYSV